MTGVAIRPKKGEKLARAEYGGRNWMGSFTSSGNGKWNDGTISKH